MPIDQIAGALAGLKAAADIARHVSAAAKALSEADLKMRVADVVDHLTTARLLIADLQEEIRTRDTRIAEAARVDVMQSVSAQHRALPRFR